MPASSYAELYDFPGNVAAAALAVLDADESALIGSDTHAVSGAFIFGPRAAEDMPPDRITVTASGFTQASDQQVQATSNNEWFFAHFNGTLQIEVQTPRAVAVASAAHAGRVGRILFLHQPRARRYTPTNLPYYEIMAIRLASAPRSEPDPDEDIDRTVIEFNVELFMLPGGFPATVP